mgnify:CR=1 FL=1
MPTAYIVDAVRTAGGRRGGRLAGVHPVDLAAMTLDALKKAGVPVFAYGNFITVAVNFIILAFIIFMMVKQINRLRREAPAAPAPAPVTPEDIVLLREIRDSLKR